MEEQESRIPDLARMKTPLKHVGAHTMRAEGDTRSMSSNDRRKYRSWNNALASSSWRWYDCI